MPSIFPQERQRLAATLGDLARSNWWTARALRRVRTEQLIRAQSGEYVWAYRLARQGTAAIDVGANVGAVTSILSKKVGRSGLVVAAEPNPVVYRQLIRGCASNVLATQVAIGSTFGEVTIQVPCDEGGHPQFQLGAIVTLPEGAPSESEKSVTHKAMQIKLDALLRVTSLDFSLVKIDVEGYELEVLRGAEELLGSQMPNIVIEIEQRHQPAGQGVNDVFAFLESYGYEIRAITANGLVPLARFNVERDQLVPLAKNDLRRNYINNFVATPGQAAER